MEKYASVIVVYAVVQLVETLIYKPEGHGFDSQSGNWIFHRPNLSDRTMALKSTQPLTEMSARSIFWGFKWAVRRVDNHNVLQYPGALRPCPV